MIKRNEVPYGTIFIASLSGGKDSACMVMRLIEEGWPLDYVLLYDSGVEFKSVVKVAESLRNKIEGYGAKFVTLHPEIPFLMEMLIKPVKSRESGEYHYGYSWCGRGCRWNTSNKIKTINSFISSLNADNVIQYLGIAADEPARIRPNANDLGIIYPLAEWNMSEQDCLHYCWNNSIHWIEGEGIPDLYTIFDRLSCFCCSNKNLKELRQMYHYFNDPKGPNYWGLLKGMQAKITIPFWDELSVFDLEQIFKNEDRQITLWDNLEFFDSIYK